MKYRLLSLMLTLSIVTGMCPVIAAGGNGAEQQNPSTQIQEQASEENLEESAEPEAGETARTIYTATASQRSGTAEDAATNAATTFRRSASSRSAVGDPNLDYVDQLSDNDAATESYRQMKNAFENSTYTLTSEGVAQIKYEPEADVHFYSETEELTSEEKSEAMKDVFLGVSAFRYDHPEIFYLDPQCKASYSYSLKSTDESGRCCWEVTSITLKIQLLFTTSNSLNTAKRKYNSAIDSALTEAKKFSERDEQVKALHDWLCNKITYLSSAEYAHSSYGSLVEGECVCEGYAKALKVLCDQLDIPCKMVLGTGYTSSGSDAHMWNYVRMDDGIWYAVDATWDDQKQKTYDDYLLVGGKSVSPAISEGRTFSDTHEPTGYFTTDTTTMQFRYPTLSEQAYVRRVQLNQTELDLVQGRADTLTAALTPESTVERPVAWSSDDEAIATVDQNGEVIAEAVGSAVITAESTNGRTASCLVNVQALEAPVLISAEMLPEEGRSIVRWEQSKGAEEYIVFRRLSTEKEWTELARTEATEYTDTTVQTDLIYYYTVCAVAKDGKTEVRSRYDETGVVCFASGIVLDPTELELEIGETATLNAIVKMDGEPTVFWSSSDTERVTVDENGNLTALRAGVVVITAQADGETAQCTVSVLPAAPELISAEGGTVRWKAVEDADAYLVYRKTSDEENWTRLTDENGITAVEYTDTTVEKGGTYHYTVRAVMHVGDQTLLSSCDQNGVQYVWEVVTLSQTELRLSIGKTAVLAAELCPGTDQAVWSSSNSSVASVDQNGKVTAESGGTAEIKLTGEYGTEATCTVIVTPAAPELISAQGGTVRWNAVSGATHYRVYRKTAGGGWKRIAVTKNTSYTDKKVQEGNVYDYTVRAYFVYDGSTVLSSYDRTGVRYILEKVTLPEQLELSLGESASLPVKITPEEAADTALTWSSSDSEVVSVDENGNVSALKLGSADITVRSENQSTAVCHVTVSAPAPELLSAENGVVKWSPVESARGYLVYRRAAGESKWTLLTDEDGITDTQYTDTTAESGAVSIYTVRARLDQDGESVLSDCDSVGVFSVPTVGGIQAASAGWDSAEITWTAVEGASGYRVYRRTGSGKWKKVASDVTDASFTDSGLTSGTEYIYTIRAYYTESGKTVIGGYEEEGAAVTPNAPIPSGLKAVSAGYDRIQVSWNAVSGADGYRVYRIGPGDSKWRTVKTVSSLTYALTNSGLTCGTAYRYTVRAYCKTDAGTIWSGYDKDGVTAKPIPATVQLVSATAGSGSVTVKWTAVSGANGYNIYRKTDGGSWKKVKTVGSSTTSWKNTGLKKGTAYTYTVRAYRTVDGTKVLGGYDKTGVTAAAK